jgi:raffinose/stachyose/melibiose transport system substrate-binding protein
MKFDNEDMLKCFEKLQQLGKSNAFSANMATQEYFDSKELFTTGKAAILNTGAWDCAELDEKLGDKVGFWWGPTFTDSSYNQNAAMKVPSAPICVSSAVANDASLQEAVYKFLEFYYSEDAAKISYEGSVFPATNYTGIAVADTQYSLKQVMASIDEGWTSPASQPDQILSSAVQTQLYDSIFGVLLGNYEPKEALDKIDQQLSY